MVTMKNPSPLRGMEEKMRGRGNTENQVKTGTFPLKDEDATICFSCFLLIST